MLIGNSLDQDTVARPFESEETEKAHVATALYRRFYRLPPDVIIRIDEVYHRLSGTRRFTPIGQRSEKFKRTESVHIPDANITVHYLHDPSVGDKSGLRMSSSNALGSSTTTCCLVHKDEMYSVTTGEMYSVTTGSEWSAAAPHFGIPFGSKELCVHVELHDDDARAAGYRERLISKPAGRDIVPQDFAHWVRERMPEWVKEVIRAASPHPKDNYNDLQKELQELLNKYKVRAPGRALSPSGSPSAAKAGRVFGRSGSGGLAGERHRSFHETPEGAVATSLYEVYEKAPNIIMLNSPEDVSEKGLKGRAASFVIETGDLFINGLYESVDRTIEDVEPEFVGQADAEFLSTAVTDAARAEMARRVGKAVVYALAKRANEDWDSAAMGAALSKESLSLAADDYLESLSRVRKRVRDSIKLERVAA